MHVQSCCFAFSSYCLFDFLVAAASLTSYYLRYIVMSQKHNIPGANWIAPADSIPNIFFDSSVVPSFLVRKVENKSFRTSLVNETSCTNLWKELRRNCSPIGHNNTKHFLCSIRCRHPLKFLEIARWESVPRGSFAGTWKFSSRLFSRSNWLPLGLRGWPVN